MLEDEIEDDFCRQILDFASAGWGDSEIAVYFGLKEKDISDRLISLTVKSAKAKAKEQARLRDSIIESAEKYRKEIEEIIYIAKENGDLMQQIKASAILLKDKYDLIDILGLYADQINSIKLTEAQVQNYNAKKRKIYAEIEQIKAKTNDLLKNGSKAEIINYYIGKPVDEIDNDITEYIKNK